MDPYVSNFELSDELRRLGQEGVDVPFLNVSAYIPRDFGSRELPPGHVMDDHGNVVDMGALRREASLCHDRKLKELVNFVSFRRDSYNR